MNRLTKYDVIDVLLVALCISYLPMVCIMLFMQAGLILQEVSRGVMLDASMFTLIFFQAGYLIAIVLVLYLVLAKRSLIIPKMFSDSDRKEITLSDGLVMLTRYSFWIRLFGIITILRAATYVVSSISAELVKGDMTENFISLYSPLAHHLVSGVLGILFVWKAEWIAATLARIGESPPAENDGDDVKEPDETDS